MQQFRFKAWSSRKTPDPVIAGAYQQTMLVDVTQLPDGLPLTPNPRRPNIDRKKWREIQRHLMNEEGTPGTFHLKNKGITVIADKVQIRKTGGTTAHVTLTLQPGHGVGDGGHTYTLINRCREELQDIATRDDQFVTVRVLVGYPPNLINEIVRGLNTAIQVQERSLADHRGAFDWIKAAIGDMPRSGRVSWAEGDDGAIDVVRDILAPAHMFLIDRYPNDGASYPVQAYTSLSRVLDHYLDNMQAYQRLADILPDLLTLHDVIRHEARELHNSAGGNAGRLAFIEGRKRGTHVYPFTGVTSQYRLARSALLPMLGAFRWLVEIDAVTGLYRWRGSFDDVLTLWRDVAPRLVRQTQQTSLEHGRKVSAIGRSCNHWQTMHATVGMAYMMRASLARH